MPLPQLRCSDMRRVRPKIAGTKPDLETRIRDLEARVMQLEQQQGQGADPAPAAKSKKKVSNESNP